MAGRSLTSSESGRWQKKGGRVQQNHKGMTEVKENYRIRILDSDQDGRLSDDLPDQATKLKLALRSSIGRSVDRQ